MKMETPKMDVVRFQEADVLAASPVRDIVKLSDLGNDDFSDNNAQGVGFNLNFSDIKNGQSAHMLKLDSTFKVGTTEQTLQNLVDNTYVSDSEGYKIFNGSYEWNNSESKYIHQ